MEDRWRFSNARKPDYRCLYEAVHDHAEPEVRDELTLGAVFRTLASAQLPARFYQVLQFSLPLAFQFWVGVGAKRGVDAGRRIVRTVGVVRAATGARSGVGLEGYGVDPKRASASPRAASCRCDSGAGRGRAAR